MSEAHAYDYALPRHPFDRFARVPEQRWLAKLIHWPDTGTAAAALERTLARLAPRVPSASDVAGIYRHYRIPPRRARRISLALWTRMFEHAEGRGVVSDGELHYLNALRVAFDLQDSDVAEARQPGPRSHSGVRGSPRPQLGPKPDIASSP